MSMEVDEPGPSVTCLGGAKPKSANPTAVPARKLTVNSQLLASFSSHATCAFVIASVRPLLPSGNRSADSTLELADAAAGRARAPAAMAMPAARRRGRRGDIGVVLLWW